MTRLNLQNNRIVSAALAGISSVAVIQLLAFDELPVLLWISLVCFSAAIPMLAVNVFALTTLEEYQNLKATPPLMALGIGGAMSSVLALICLFAHLSFIAAIIFVVSGLIALALGAQNDKILQSLNNAEKDDQSQQ